MTEDTTLGSTELAVPDSERIALALKGETKIEDLVFEIAAKVAAMGVPDVSRPAGRKEITSLANRVVRSKTAIDEAGKQMNAGLRAQIDEVDRRRRYARTELDAIRDHIRVPLVEWEDAEAERKRQHEERLASLAVDLPLETSSADVGEAIEAVEAIEVGSSWEEFEPQARAAKAATLDRLYRQKAAAEAREEQERELARLRAEAAERAASEAREREERERREAEERREREEQEAEADRQRQAQEKADRERQAAELAEARRAAEKAEARNRAREQHAAVLHHIHEAGAGRIGGERQPIGLLFRELESKVPPEITPEIAKLEPNLEQARQTAIASLRAMQESMRAEAQRAEAERQRKEAEEAEAAIAKLRAQQERQAKANKKARAERRKRIVAEIAKSFEEAIPEDYGDVGASDFAEAIYDGKIRHVRVEEDAE